MKEKHGDWLYIIVIFIIGSIIFFLIPIILGSSNSVNVKYREDNVDISADRFEEFDTSKSSFIRGAWYDEGNNYMIINLSGTYYHYCGKPRSSWDSFKSASSLGEYYNQRIKGSYDCRIYAVPDY